MIDWDATIQSYEGQLCFAGVDLSATSDFTACVYLFQNQDDPTVIDLLARAWCPEDYLYNSKNRYRDFYQAWEKQGYLTTTPGNVIDYDIIHDAISSDYDKLWIYSVTVDALYQGVHFMNMLADDGIKIVPKRMGYSLAPATNEFEKKFLERKLNHGGNPVFRFCADNVCLKNDSNNNRTPDKGNSQGKIDLVVCAVLAMDQAMSVGFELGNANDGSLINIS